MFFYMSLLMISSSVYGQNTTKRIQDAFRQFESDDQVKHALVSLYVIDAKTGKVVFDRNSQIGLAPASTQKIITSVTAFELLGKDYRYKTDFGITVVPEGHVLYVKGSGDPTLGSWRWEHTKEEQVRNRIKKAIEVNASKIHNVRFDTTGWGDTGTPDGWIWQDIGNYYGAGAGSLNWRENQYDLILKTGPNAGDPVEVVRTEPRLYADTIFSMATAGAKGSGDNAYIYKPGERYAKYGTIAGSVVKGTIPAGESAFKISGSMLNPFSEFKSLFFRTTKHADEAAGIEDFIAKLNTDVVYIHQEVSPPLDSIIYWFNKKSINLYGEALIKTIGYEKNKKGYTREGLRILRSFWKENGLDEEELNMVDGSGLSPLNRVTTHAQVTILNYARSGSWYPSFYDALPEYNGMKMKSGTISGAKGFCGYHKAKDGNEYIFSFLVNNYSGKVSSLVSKMYTVLDVLK
jgi:D-alanyl-D-alanine carboxypeptidase/D-alanyl-D-alanine-endopeptidase (penicillin-binding protein 4)